MLHFPILLPQLFITNTCATHHRHKPARRRQWRSTCGARPEVCPSTKTALGFAPGPTVALFASKMPLRRPRRRSRSFITNLRQQIFDNRSLITTECSRRNRPFSWPKVSIGHAGLTIPIWNKSGRQPAAKTLAKRENRAKSLVLEYFTLSRLESKTESKISS